ncbi:protein Shroom3 isoform X2 [Amia ocellicauda]|uniref:protein Shroom3 isoform X2 n=1 Tax=Amia ocellicauda TaxID=2972642 RepID=UPI0034647B49
MDESQGASQALEREVCLDKCSWEPAAPPQLSPPFSHGHPQESKSVWQGGVKLRIKNRRSEAASRPHSWHSTKLGESQQDPSMMQISQGTIGTAWHQTYHSSSSTSDLTGYDHGYLRKSPDQYSSRGSMESLDHGHPVYSSCHQLSPSKSSNSIDHLHSKRDSAYSSFSTSSSIPEYPAASFSKERSFSMENMNSQRGPEGMRQADIRYVRTVYDPQQGISEEHEVSSSALVRNSDGKVQSDIRGGVIYHNHNSYENQVSNRHSIGPVWGQTHHKNMYESVNVKGPPAPPMRSDSYAAIKNHDRPNSWSSLEQARSSRALQKGYWPHPGTSITSGKSSFSAEGQLHTVVEKSPESSPTTKPKQNFSQATQPGKLMLPTGIYPVPQPEPHFAQVPTSCPTSSGLVYPVLAKESRYSSQNDQSTDPNIEGGVSENGYQSNISSTIANQPSGYHQPKPFQNQQDKKQEESETKFHYKSHFKSDIYATTQTQSQEHRCLHSPRNSDEDRRDSHTSLQQSLKGQKCPQSNEILDKQQWKREEEPTRAVEGSHQLDTSFLQNNLENDVFLDGQGISEQMQMEYGSCRDISAQGSYDDKNQTASNLGGELRRHPSSKHHSESIVWQQPPSWHENASHDGQRSRSPDSSRSHSSIQSAPGGKSDVTAVRISVLEKVNQIEQREQKQQRSHSTSSTNYSLGFSRLSQSSRGKSSYSSIEDIRSRLKMTEGSNAKAPAHGKMQGYVLEGKTMGGLEDFKQPQPQAEADKKQRNREQQFQNNPQSIALPLQRSKSTFQLKTDENGKDFHWKEDLQDILGTIQDTSFNRAYRDSIKDAQSKVLRSTSFRRKDLLVNPPQLNKHMSLDRGTSTKTNTKPGGVSPHTPRERHVVTPEEVGQTLAPELPSALAVGPPVPRICGRKRLTLEQKKRSYSEPEKINELGVSDVENLRYPSQKKGPQHFLFPETSVADRRRMFEPEARNGPAVSPGISRPELKQLQQTALAEYIERKTGHKVHSRHRPHSSYVHPSSYDSQSLSSASSLISLQDQSLQWGSYADSLPGSRQVSSTLPPGHQASFYYDSNLSRQSSSNSSFSGRANPEKHLLFCSSERELNKTIAASTERLQSHRHSTHILHQQQPERSFERGSAARSSGKSASAEDLLERSEERTVPHHIRSRSSPSVERLNKDFVMGENKPFGNLWKEPLNSAGHEMRQTENVKTERMSVSPHRADRYSLNEGPHPLSSSWAQREKQKQGQRQRPSSASGLAPVLGLPSRPLLWDNSNLDIPEWLSHASITAQTQVTAPSPVSTVGSMLEVRSQGDKPSLSRQSSSDTNTSEETLKDVQREAYCPQRPAAPKTTWATSYREKERDLSFPQDLGQSSSGRGETESNSSEPETPLFSQTHPLPSLRISESNLLHTPPSCSPQDDEVFLQDPRPDTPCQPLPSPPPPPLAFQVLIRETDITEDFPPPPPLIAEDQDSEPAHPSAALPHPKSTDRALDTEERVLPGGRERTLSSSTTPSIPFDGTRRHSKPNHAEEAATSPVHTGDQSGALETEEDLGIPGSDLLEKLQADAALFSQWEKSAEEVRSEQLARQIISKDESLAHILDSSTMKNTMNLMEDIFPTASILLQQKQGLSEGKKSEDQASSAVLKYPSPLDPLLQSQLRQLETNLDEEEPGREADINQKKMELLDSIVRSVEALRGAKETLSAELKRNSALGDEMEVIVQESCRPNECEKYQMFIGDLDKIVNLLLSLSGRLARVENSLRSLDPQASAEEREALEQKRKVLCAQYQDARELKENLDRRERVVLEILGGYLSGRQLIAYQHFVWRKSALLIKQREIDDWIRLREEQLQGLRDTLPPGLPSQESTPSAAPSSPVYTPRPSAPCLPTTVTSL